MRILCNISVLLSAACVTLLAAEGEDRSPSEKIAEMISDLASESYQAREQATEQLWATGEVALLQLENAAESDDPEMAIRAAEVLEKIQLQITPDTPPEVTDMIRRYQDAPDNQKLNFLNELKRLKAYFQVLRLYSTEQSPEVRAQLAPAIRGVAILGAREAIVDGDTGKAVRLLEMSAGEPSELMALACLYRTLGKLDEKLENPQAPVGVSTELWKIAMLRAKGDLEGAAALAAESKQTRLLAGIRVLTGDPTLWITQNGFSDPTREARRDYVDIALKRWNGRKLRDSDFADLLTILKEQEPGSEERAHAVSTLASLGRLAEVETALAKDNLAAGFEYFLSQERIPEALGVMGLDPEKPDFVAWVAQRFNKISGDDEDDENSSQALSELQMMAGFMESRGLNKEIAASFGSSLDKFAKQNENHFLDFLSSLFQPGVAPKYAVSVGSKWAGDDENRWGEIFTVAFGEAEEVMEWLNWVAEIDPELDNAGKMEVMLALFKVGSDPTNLRSKWLERAWKFVDAAPENTKTRYLKRIKDLAIAQQDVASALKAWDMLGIGEGALWRTTDKFLSAAGRWGDAAEVLDGNAKFSTSSSPELHAYLATTLRKAGDEKRAVEHDLWAEKLSLGYSPSCKRIGDFYTYGGDPKRATVWYQRAAFQADPSENEFASALNAYADLMKEQENWDVAASCYEALVQIYAGRNFVDLPPAVLAKARLSADLAKALAILPEDRERALSLLEKIHANFATDGVLADDFFPSVRKAGLTGELQRWFSDSWKRLSEVIAKYPDSDNTRNTAAWLASRAGMKLDEANAHLERALELRPDQPAYLDTMAETHFAMGDRKAAIKWSDKGVMFYPLTDGRSDLMIRKQNYRFRHGALPN